MPPLTRRELRKLVRKLGVVARPREQKQALVTVVQLCRDGDEDSLAAIAEAAALAWV
ncbi:hypothetical protein FOA52_013727 [Chlamydomonas sp. UWO 241]|nr:hypothetical protein FOA52_013727 [Chlamydomonas sp. UWO 241]